MTCTWRWTCRGDSPRIGRGRPVRVVVPRGLGQKPPGGQPRLSAGGASRAKNGGGSPPQSPMLREASCQPKQGAVRQGPVRIQTHHGPREQDERDCNGGGRGPSQLRPRLAPRHRSQIRQGLRPLSVVVAGADSFRALRLRPPNKCLVLWRGSTSRVRVGESPSRRFDGWDRAGAVLCPVRWGVFQDMRFLGRAV